LKSLAIRSTRIITNGQVVNGVLMVEDGIIQGISGELPNDPGISIIEASDNIVMAGVIDPHVHINEPGRTEWEGFETATRSAVAGGITTLVDMPLNSSPVTTTPSAFDNKINATNGKLYTNCGFWGGIIPGNTDQIEPLISKGILGFKAFLTHSGIDDFPNVTESDLRMAMPVIAQHGLPLLVHCELLPEIVQPLPGDNRSYLHYLKSRPPEWEDRAIALMIRLCEEFNCRVHIVHLSSANSIEQIAIAKKKGLPITVESAQHYLYFKSENIPDGATEFKCAPPIRESVNNELLWRGLKEGIIDFVATDHSPCTPNLKKKETGDFMQAWGGISSIQFALPILWTATEKRNCNITNMALWLSENPAKLIGKQNKKGQIAAGYDADLVIWNEKSEFRLEESMILHKHRLTPYLGEKLKGVINQTILSGEVVFDRGNFTSPPQGKIITG